MKKIITIFLLLLIPFAANSQFNDEVTLYSIQIDLSEFNPEPLAIKKSIIKALFKRGWKIQQHTRNMLTAKYKTNVIKISIDNQLVKIEDDGAPMSSAKKWIQSLKILIKQDMEYYRYVKEAEAQLKL